LDKASDTVTRIKPIPTPPTFVAVEPQNVAQVWDTILPGLMKVWRRGEGWRVEDVYTAIKTGQAYLHIAMDAGDYAGFVVSQPQQAPDGVVLHLWALYADGGHREHFATWLGQIDEWARGIKAKRITFHSPRRGWEKLGQQLGFKPAMTVYERSTP
jgi:hypothetical protein